MAGERLLPIFRRDLFPNEARPDLDVGVARPHRGLLYILGVRERADKLVRDLVLDDPAPFVPLVLTKRNKDIESEAKAVTLAGRRYIVCRDGRAGATVEERR